MVENDSPQHLDDRLSADTLPSPLPSPAERVNPTQFDLTTAQGCASYEEALELLDEQADEAQ